MTLDPIQTIQTMPTYLSVRVEKKNSECHEHVLFEDASTLTEAINDESGSVQVTTMEGEVLYFLDNLIIYPGELSHVKAIQSLDTLEEATLEDILDRLSTCIVHKGSMKLTIARIEFATSLPEIN